MTPKPRDLESLALVYAATRAARDRNALCEAALPLVRRIASLIIRRLPAHFSIDDLVGDGSIGLLRAMDRFDPAYGVQFETWASRIVRGQMLNGLRRMDVVPERVRRDARSLDSARWRLAQASGGAPNDRKAAESAGLSAQKLEAVQLALRSAAPLSLSTPLRGGPEGAIVADRIASGDAGPLDRIVERDVRRAVRSAMLSLPARDRHIIAAFYAGNITFREIGNRLGISKQRVSQIHNRALRGLRSALTAMAVHA